MRAASPPPPLQRGRRLVTAAALASALAAQLCAGAAPAAAKLSGTPRAYTASSGAVTATLTATEFAGGAGAPTTFQDLHLQILRAGASAYSAAVSSPHCQPCGLEGFSGAPPPVQVAVLQPGGEPDVVVDLYTGGAHCCSIVQVLSYDPASATYLTAERDFGDPGALLADVAGNGSMQFESADDRFAYAFAPYAYSGLPMQILAFGSGGFHDVTRSFPAAVAADAARWLKGFRAERRHGLGNGLIAAWAADEELLGHRRLVARTLAREARHGRLRSREHYGPSNGAFVRALMRFLKRTGYIR